MACPYMRGGGGGAVGGDQAVNGDGLSLPARRVDQDPTKSGFDRLEMTDGSRTYGSYLQLDSLLGSQKPVTDFHDENLFIITHQAFELWFKQVILEIDSVRDMLIAESEGGVTSLWNSESKMLTIVSRLHRVRLIIKVTLEQFSILETMTPLSFMDFRGALAPASGFQSLQFRLLENKLGVPEDQRVKYNQQHYRKAFAGEAMLADLDASCSEPSLRQLVQQWLEKTPGLEESRFWEKYSAAAGRYLDEEFLRPAQEETEPEAKRAKEAEYKKEKDTFETILDETRYQTYVARGERRLSHKAFQGAMMIFLHSEEPRFHSPFQVLELLVDIDSLLIKWRSNHVLMVQRMIGSRMGTGGSSGYQYLRSTVSDRYKVFLDLFNLASFLLPRELIAPLDDDTRQFLKSSTSADAPPPSSPASAGAQQSSSSP